MQILLEYNITSIHIITTTHAYSLSLHPLLGLTLLNPRILGDRPNTGMSLLYVLWGAALHAGHTGDQQLGLFHCYRYRATLPGPAGYMTLSSCRPYKIYKKITNLRLICTSE